MNTAAAQLAQAIASAPLVITLHAPNGETRCVFATAQLWQASQVLEGWAREYFPRGYLALAWQGGVPVQTYGSR